MRGTRIGQYELEALIGKGGLGEVYRARNARTDRLVAVKILRPGPAATQEQLETFMREARTGALLNHPNIAAVHDVGTHDGAPFIVAELLEGETLRSRLSMGPLPLHLAVSYARQIADGLVAAHEIGVVHRDLKPENVFIVDGAVVKILDFGLAGWRQEALEQLQDTTVATWPHALLGVVGYMSPEQVRGLPLDERSDLFSVGAMLFEMMAGVPPFRGRSPIETLGLILKQETPPLRLRNGRKIAPELERIVRHCLVKDPEYRVQSARDLVFNLETSGSGPLVSRRRHFDVRPAVSNVVSSLLRLM